MSTVIRIAIIENHPLFRRGLIGLLDEVADMTVGWTVSTVPELQLLLQTVAERPDVVLLDRSLPGGGPQGTKAVAALVADGLRVLVVSAADTAEAVVSAVEAGACGYVSKDAAEDETIHAIRAAMQGLVHISQALALPTSSHAATRVRLTPREREVVRLVARGDTDADIARQLRISPYTVISHLDRIAAKAGVRNRRKLAGWAATEGYLST